MTMAKLEMVKKAIEEAGIEEEIRAQVAAALHTAGQPLTAENARKLAAAAIAYNSALADIRRAGKEPRDCYEVGDLAGINGHLPFVLAQHCGESYSEFLATYK